ncbi:60S ribosomal protein L28-2 [Platanthera zijinensis]|uniref:60S ribosomal protein L28-2 n=1 Tax=Platanthera zijinensis TaxID=2320716 RepID=A0AAP0BNF0_9ASPA
MGCYRVYTATVDENKMTGTIAATVATIPDALIWEIVRKNNAFLAKQFGNGNAKVQFSKEKNNLFNFHSFKYSGCDRRQQYVCVEAVTLHPGGGG